jgi:RNA methyltransferase, TrmH family
MKEVISSSQNKQIKHVKSLHAKKHRDSLMQYIIEGYKLIDEAIEYQKPFYLLLLCETALTSAEGNELLQRCEKANISVYITDEKLFSDVSQMETPQGALAVLHKQEQDIKKVLDKSNFNIMILDEVRDPGNVGTIIRTADACGLDGIILSQGCVDLYNSKTLRATMGSIFHIPIVTDVDIVELIDKLKSIDTEVLGADPHSNISCIDIERQQRTAIVIGNEANGLKDEVKTATTRNITIPMPGMAESLNAGVAAAILMYEFAVRKNI